MATRKNIERMGLYVPQNTVTLQVRHADPLDFEALSTQLGVAPTGIVKQGQVIRKLGVAPINMWSYEVDVDNTEPMDVHLQALLDQFASRREELAEIASKSDVTINCFRNTEFAQASFTIPANVLSFFGALDIDFEIDLFSYGKALPTSARKKSGKRRDHSAQGDEKSASKSRKP